MTVTTVRERPILFSGSMVRALLAGTKTQTRRVVRFPNDVPDVYLGVGSDGRHTWRGVGRFAGQLPCPYGAPGDRLWVRETMRADDSGVWDYAAGGKTPDGVGLYREQDDPTTPAMVDWIITQKRSVCPAIHMPRWASRLTLEITDVRVQRISEISTHDIGAEGINLHNNRTGARTEFRTLWDSLNAKRGYPWDSNPWVWVLSFRRAEA